MLCSALTCQVYVGTWQHTPVAVKILLNTSLDVYNEEAVKQALTLSNPVLENLQKVRKDGVLPQVYFVDARAWSRWLSCCQMRCGSG